MDFSFSFLDMPYATLGDTLAEMSGQICALRQSRKRHRTRSMVELANNSSLCPTILAVATAPIAPKREAECRAPEHHLPNSRAYQPLP